MFGRAVPVYIYIYSPLRKMIDAYIKAGSKKSGERGAAVNKNVET